MYLLIQACGSRVSENDTLIACESKVDLHLLSYIIMLLEKFILDQRPRLDIVNLTYRLPAG